MSLIRKINPPDISWSILIGAAIISLAILINSGVVKFKGLGSYKFPSSSPAIAARGPVKVTVDDDPVLGDPNAPVALIEFSDYECPYCKMYFEQVHSEVKRDYIDKGKIKFVYKDLASAKHFNAHKEAQAANCAKGQGGDLAYFRFHDEIFARTESGGRGLSLDQLPLIAKKLRLDVSLFQQCLALEKYKDEVDQDLKEAKEAAVEITPTFFLGYADQNGIMEGVKHVGTTGKTEEYLYEIFDQNGELVGYKIVGILPYSVLRSRIDKLLK